MWQENLWLGNKLDEVFDGHTHAVKVMDDMYNIIEHLENQIEEMKQEREDVVRRLYESGAFTEEFEKMLEIEMGFKKY